MFLSLVMDMNSSTTSVVFLILSRCFTVVDHGSTVASHSLGIVVGSCFHAVH